MVLDVLGYAIHLDIGFGCNYHFVHRSALRALKHVASLMVVCFLRRIGVSPPAFLLGIPPEARTGQDFLLRVRIAKSQNAVSPIVCRYDLVFDAVELRQRIEVKIRPI